MLFPVRLRRLIAGGVVWSLAAVGQTLPNAPFQCEQDGRCRTLKSYFARQGSPLQHLADRFIESADRYGLDWRLLPGIAMVESSGGKTGRRNNIFGWNSGRTRFPTVAAGIDFVASRLAHSPIYRGRTSRKILDAYNPVPKNYAPKVIQVMQRLEPGPVH